MRYHYEKKAKQAQIYGVNYICNHPVYKSCTLYKLGNKGLAVIQQRFDQNSKKTWWSEIDACLANDLYLHPKFKAYFNERAGPCENGLYPTVTVRQMMWALKIKPLKRERWETYFDRKNI